MCEEFAISSRRMLHRLLLYLVFSERISGCVAVDISACSGESVKLFNNMSFTRNGSVVSLYASKFNLTAMHSHNYSVDSSYVNASKINVTYMHSLSDSSDSSYVYASKYSATAMYSLNEFVDSYDVNASKINLSLNDSFDSSDVNASEYDIIAMWYKGKINKVLGDVSLDDHGTVWIHNITPYNERIYKVTHSINGNPADMWEAQLTVFVAPTKACTLNITSDGKTLTASTQGGTDCGKPEAVPYLLTYPNITYHSKINATLTPGRESGTYYACIETPALRCARNFKPSDFCTSTTVHESSYNTPLIEGICISVPVALGLAGLIVTVTIIIQYLCRKCTVRLDHTEESQSMNEGTVRLDHTEESQSMNEGTVRLDHTEESQSMNEGCTVNMMIFFFIYVTIPEREAHSIYACRGESARLFRNIKTMVYGTETFLYKNSSLIASWSKSYAEQTDGRVSHNNYGNIWMHNIDVADTATYTVMQITDEMPSEVLYEVRLIVVVSPEKSCRLQLTREDNTLIAFLENVAACGNRRVKVVWRNYTYIALENQAKAKLSLEKEAGTYYACIELETPALRCARRFKPVDFCSSLTIGESNYHTGSTATVTAITVISAICSALLLMTLTNCFH